MSYCEVVDLCCFDAVWLCRVCCEIDDLSCYYTMYGYIGLDGRGELCNSVKLMILVVMMLYGYIGFHGRCGMCNVA